MLRRAAAGLLAVALLSGVAQAILVTPDERCAAAKAKLGVRKHGSLERCFVRRYNFGCDYNLTCCQSAVFAKFAAKFDSLVERYRVRGVICLGEDALSLEDTVDRNTFPPFTPLPQCVECPLTDPCCR